MYVAHERRAYILKLLERQGHLRSADLAQELGVTDETIRTDLVALQRKGLLERVHGGARYILPAGDPAAAGQRLDCGMADVVAEHISPGMCLYLDAAPFSLVLAWRLRDTPCKLVIASPHLLTRLGAVSLGHRLFCPGGEWDKASGLIRPSTGALGVFAAQPLHLAVLRPDAVRRGRIGYSDPARAAWAKAAIAGAEQCVIAVPAESLHGGPPCTLPCTPDILVTEDNVPPELQGHPGLHTLPYISRESLLPADRFDY